MKQVIILILLLAAAIGALIKGDPTIASVFVSSSLVVGAIRS